MYEHLFQKHAVLLKALAHSHRLEIIHLLRDGAMTVGHIQDMLGLPQANISQHLRILLNAGAVVRERKGKHIEYRLAHPNFTKASDAMRVVLIEQMQGRTPNELTRRMRDLTPIVQDPVCGMRVSPHTAGASALHRKHRYYFCAPGCKKAFIQKPQRYVRS